MQLSSVLLLAVVGLLGSSVPAECGLLDPVVQAIRNIITTLPVEQVVNNPKPLVPGLPENQQATGLLPQSGPLRPDIKNGNPPIINANSSLIWKLAAIAAKMDPRINEMIYCNDTVARKLVSVYNNLGVAECKSFDHLTGIPLFSTLWGNGKDFGGNLACSGGCGGTCIPFNSTTDPGAPPSLYPFACECSASKCTANGPMPDPNWNARIPGTDNQCAPSTECDCGKAVGKPADSGYLCNWIVLDNRFVSIGLPPSTSLIRWCECCPPESANVTAPASVSSPINLSA